MAKREQKPAIHFAEDEQTEKLQEWWKKNGVSIIVGLVIGVASVAGYQGWNIYQVRQAEAASDLYQKMLRDFEVDLVPSVRAFANDIIDKYASTAYGDAASLMLAKLDFEAGALDDADDHLRRVMDESKDIGIQHIARLRRISMAIDKDDLSLADQLLNVEQRVGFESRYEEFKGDLLMVRGNTSKAREAYESALDFAIPGSVSAQILDRKINRASGSIDSL